MYYRYMHIQKDILIFWAPRILSLFGVAFLSLFSLDVFEGNPILGTTAIWSRFPYRLTVSHWLE